MTPKPRQAQATPMPCAGHTNAPADVVAEVSGTPAAAPAAAPPAPVAPAPLVPVSPWLMPPPKERPPFEPWVFSCGPASEAKPDEPAARVDLTLITVKHWGRLLDGALLAKSRHVDWATLMQRSWGHDVMKCSACGHRMRVLATITDPTVVRQILDHLPRAPARDPAWDQQTFRYDDEAA